MVDYTVWQIDDLCSRTDRACDELSRPGLSPQDEERFVAEAVQAVQRIGEGIAWAYGQQNRPSLGEEFAQPFVDRKMRERLKALLTIRSTLRRESENRLAAQILQTIHILLQATPPDSLLFCNLTSTYYLNEIVSAQFDFRGNDDLLPLWITVVKDIALMLNRDNMILFYNPEGRNPFPIFSEAVRYYHHPASQVRTHVQATSLEIFLKLRHEDFWTGPLFQLVLDASAVFFTHVCCLLREFWRMFDDAVLAGARRDARSALHIQNDILMYVNDIFTCEIPQISAILQEKLLRFAVLPVLFRSMLASAAADSIHKLGSLSAPTAWYLLHDALSTLRNAPVFNVAACTLLQPEVPEEFLRLVSTPPPCTPTDYVSCQGAWTSQVRPGSFEHGTPLPDEALYEIPVVQLAALLQNHNGALPWVHNTMLDVLMSLLHSLGSTGEMVAMSAPLLDSTVLMLKSLREAGNILADNVAQRLAGALCSALAQHRKLKWSTLVGALRALRVLAAEVEAASKTHTTGSRTAQPEGSFVVAQILRDRILGPLTGEILQEQSTRLQPGPEQDRWLQEFQEQWIAHNTELSLDPACPEGGQRRDVLLEDGSFGAPADPVGAPQGRARCLRVLLSTWRIILRLVRGCGIQSQDAGGECRLFGPSPANGDLDTVLMSPGLDDDEVEEGTRYRPDMPVEYGRGDRVMKCELVRDMWTVAAHEVVYLLPTKSMLVLARPDDHKVLSVVPVVAEPLRLVRLFAPGSENAPPIANGRNWDESQRTLRFEVYSPSSPLLLQSELSAAGGFPRQVSDPISMSMPIKMSSILRDAIRPIVDPMAASVPITPSMRSGGPVDTAAPGAPVPKKLQPLKLLFADERRKRLAYKLLSQARHATCQRTAEKLECFITQVRGSVVLAT